MADTLRGDFSSTVCSDCGEMGCSYKHWGSLVPENENGSFCCFCWLKRYKYHLEHNESLPLGVKPPGIPEEFQGKVLTVITESGSVYFLRPLDGKNEVSVCRRENSLNFSLARVLCLAYGQQLVLKPRDGDSPSLWFSRSVETIS